MKVRELREILKGEDQEAEVHLAHDSGDHWHTIVAPRVRRVEECPVVYSEYHRMPQVLDEEDDRSEDAPTAVVLFG